MGEVVLGRERTADGVEVGLVMVSLAVMVVVDIFGLRKGVVNDELISAVEVADLVAERKEVLDVSGKDDPVGFQRDKRNAIDGRR